MKKHTKRILSSILSFAMGVSAVFSGNISQVFAQRQATSVEVWDFGGVAQSDGDGVSYTNYITTDFLDNLAAVGDAVSGNKGKFLATGTVDFGGGLSVTANSNDRMYYLISSDGTSSTGLRSAGAQGKALKAYPDGYTANGMYYCNGTGNESRRYITVSDLSANDVVTVYTGPSNTTDTPVYFTNGGQTLSHTVVGGEQDRIDYVVPADGDGKIWFDGAGGKPTVNRVVRKPAVKVSGNIDLKGLSVAAYEVEFENKTTGAKTAAALNGNSYSVSLAPGYDYTAVMKNATGFGFTNSTKTFSVLDSDIANGKSANLDVEIKQTYTASGSVSGFAAGYDISNAAMILTPDAKSLADVVRASFDTSALTYTAVLEPDVDYTVSFEGVNDYEVTEGAVLNYNKPVTHNITVSAKALYNVSGKLQGLNGTAVTALNFVNEEDGYSYSGSVSGDTYTAALRAGNYSVAATANGYHTNGHVSVVKKDVTKDILFVPDQKPTPDVSWASEIYVGVNKGQYHYDTVKEALEAAKVMAPKSEAERITIYIAPGTYREQLSVETPYLTFKATDASKPTVLSWYYGIGYKYYSADNTGYYNEENAFDKYGKNPVSKWGTATYIKKTATDFKAEGITFEASFNKYVTDEEIEDGVEVADIASKFERKLGADVKSKAATERSTAISIEADRAEFRNCTFTGSQDTLYMGDNTNTYYTDCTVIGNTDYIFGSGNAIFDGCELRFAGYSDSAVGGYVTAGRSNNATSYKGWYFRSCEITGDESMKVGAGMFGRPWDAGADITFLNTKLQSSGIIDAAGWTDMSGVTPEGRAFKEANTTYNGESVDVSSRRGQVIEYTNTAANYNSLVNAQLSWDPTFFVPSEESIDFTVAPYLSSQCDVAAPETGYTMNVKYSVNAQADASLISWYRVDDAGNKTLVKTSSALTNDGYDMTKDDIGYYIEAVVTPILSSGISGTAKSSKTGNKVVQGSGSKEVDRPGGKNVIFIAGDSTTKDYSAGAINNSGANRPEGSWGEFLPYFLADDASYEVMDYAEGGRSSQSFINEGRLDTIKNQMLEGDYLFVQFGHNDSSQSYADRYVPVGTPDASGVYPTTEGTFKYFLKMYIDAAKEKGATPVMFSPVARMYFSNGKIRAHHDDNTSQNNAYVEATKQVAEENGVLYIDSFELTKQMYEDAYAADPNAAGDESPLATRLFAPGEKTHHSKLGGFVIAAKLAKILQDEGLPFSSEISAPVGMDIADDKGYTEFTVSTKGVFTGYDKDETGVYSKDVVDTYWSGFANKALEELEASSVTGDANGDGSVDSKDASIVLQHTSGIATLEGKELTSADVNGDGSVDSKDASLILQYTSGSITSF